MKLGLVFGSEMVFYVFFRLEYPASSNGVTRGLFFLSEPVIRYRNPGYVSTAGLKPSAGNPAGSSVMFRIFTDWIEAYSSSLKSMGICFLKASLNEISDSVRANPNGCNLLWIMLNRCWLFLA